MGRWGGGVESVGEAEEDVFQAAPLVDQLVEDDLVLGGEGPEPLGGGAVDDQRVRGDLAPAPGTALSSSASRVISGVRMRRPVPVPAWAAMSARVVWRTSFPCEMITTSSTVSSISDKRWEETSTA